MSLYVEFMGFIVIPFMIGFAGGLIHKYGIWIKGAIVGISILLWLTVFHIVLSLVGYPAKDNKDEVITIESKNVISRPLEIQSLSTDENMN